MSRSETSPFSQEDFLALGENQIVYRRRFTGKQLKAMYPEAKNAPEAAQFEALYSADGTPVLITDDHAAVLNWLQETGHDMAVRH